MRTKKIGMMWLAKKLISEEAGGSNAGSFSFRNALLAVSRRISCLEQPVQDYLRAVKYKPPRLASEGARFIFLSKTLRSSLLSNPDHSAKNLAELDTVIWLEYGKR